MKLFPIVSVLAVTFGALAPAQAGQTKSAMLPPDVGYPTGLLEKMEEPPLWSPDSVRGYDHRIRLSISGINRLSVAIRIDVLRNGRGLGTVLTSYRNVNGSRNEERGVFVVSAAKMKQLHAAIADAQLWKSPRQSWSLPAGSNDICIDGEEMLFERVDVSGYRVAGANAQCEAPGKLIAVAQKMIDFSGVRRASKLLY